MAQKAYKSGDRLNYYPGIKLNKDALNLQLNTEENTLKVRKNKKTELITYTTSYDENGVHTDFPEESVKDIVKSAGAYLIDFDFKRLLDYLAFEIGHLSYDSEEYSKEKLDKLLGASGLLYPCDCGIIEKVVPQDFSLELEDFCVDTDIEMIYANQRKGEAYDYLLNVIKLNKKYTSYLKILQNQNRELIEIALLHYFTIATSHNIKLQLVKYTNTGFTLLTEYKQYTNDKYYLELTNSVLFTVCGRKFEYVPEIHKTDKNTRQTTKKATKKPTKTK